MANTILLKRSAVHNKVPAVGDLALGEIGINTYDGKMFVKKNDGSDSVVEIGGPTNADLVSTNTATFTNNLSAADSTVQLALETLDNLSVASGSIDTTNFDGKLSAADSTIQKALDTLDDAPGGVVQFTDKTSTGLEGLLVGNLFVVNDFDGIVKLFKVDDMTGVTAATDVQTALSNNNVSAISQGVIYNKSYLTATGGETNHTIDYTVGYIDIYVDGVKLIDTEDFTANNGTSVTFTTALNAGEKVTFQAWSTDTITTTGPSYSTQSSAYTASQNEFIYADTSAGAFTITLPASPVMNKRVQIIDNTSSFGTNNLTVARNGETIMGLASDLVINTDNDNKELIYNGSDWRII